MKSEYTFANPYTHFEWTDYTPQEISALESMFRSEGWKLLSKEMTAWGRTNYDLLRQCELSKVEFHRGVLENLSNLEQFLYEVQRFAKEAHDEAAKDNEREIMGDD